MGIGMGAGAVHRHVGADADAADHVADLADDVIGENPAGIVFNDGKADAVDSHDGAHDRKHFKARECPAQNIHRRFCRKRAHENRAANGCLRVGISQPGMQGRHRGIEHETRP